MSISVHLEQGERPGAHGRWRRQLRRVPRPAAAAAAAVLAALAGLALAPAGAGAQEIHGFVEELEGVRTAQGGGFESGSYTARETRVQLKIADYSDRGEYFLRIDLPFDRLTEADVDLELREGYFTYTGFSSFDFKVGRQIMTWGTGDLLFINDIFPKDWQSFFIGREDQYLKAPMDALRFGFYGNLFNLSVVAMPRFEPDRLPAADRLAFYDPLPEPVAPRDPGDKIDDGELAVRADRTLGATEVALYGYWGYYRQPVGLEPATMQPFYPRLQVYGASARRGLLGGVASGELGYYGSRDDPDGDNPAVENSTLRLMAGFDRQLWTDFQLGLQGYTEWMADHDLYRAGLPAGAFARDAWRQLYTARLTQFLNYQTLRLSLFTFWSPSDDDYYVRAKVSYKLSDPVELLVGANVFGGTHRETLFGQLDADDNVYLRARYSF